MTFSRGRIRGIESRLDMPRWGRFSGYLSYVNLRGIVELPTAGGLFLDDNPAQELTLNTRFPVSQDQRNTARAATLDFLERLVQQRTPGRTNTARPQSIK